MSEPTIDHSAKIAETQSQDAKLLDDGAPPPPRHLQERVIGDYYSDFISSGAVVLTELEAALAPSGYTLGQFQHVLDFGSGPGRVARAFRTRFAHAKVTAADIDPEAIGWLRENMDIEAVLLPHMPPSTLDASAFDLVYAISVFTHLNEEMQVAWLDELRRLTAPGGVLLLTVVGSHDLGEQEFRFDAAGTTSGLPDFYRTTFHTERYVRRVWSLYFDVRGYVPKGAANHQDIVVCVAR